MTTGNPILPFGWMAKTEIRVAEELMANIAGYLNSHRHIDGIGNETNLNSLAWAYFKTQKVCRIACLANEGGYLIGARIEGQGRGYFGEARMVSMSFQVYKGEPGYDL